MGHKLISVAALSGAALTLTPVGVNAQDPDERGGFSFESSITTRIDVDDNAALDLSSIGTTSVLSAIYNFEVLSETRNQTLSFDFSAIGRVADRPLVDGISTVLDEPKFDFTYLREGANSLFEFNADYRVDLIEFEDLFATTVTTPGQDIGTGSRTTYGFDTVLDLGIEGPLGATFSLGADSLDFDDATDDDSVPEDTFEAGVALRFGVTRNLDLLATYEFDRLERDAPTELLERDTTSASIGFSYLVSPRLRISGEVGQTEVDADRTTATGTTNTTNDGNTAEADIFYELPRGNVSLSFDRSVGEIDTQDTISVGRQFAFPNSTLDISVGFTSGETGDGATALSFDDYVAEVAYERDFRRGSMRLTAERAVRADNEQNVLIDSTVLLSLTREINSRSSVTVEARYGLEEDAGTTAAELLEEIEYGARYDREITPDWNFGAGVLVQQRRDDTGTAVSNSVFFELRRDFRVRP